MHKYCLGFTQKKVHDGIRIASNLLYYEKCSPKRLPFYFFFKIILSSGRPRIKGRHLPEWLNCWQKTQYSQKIIAVTPEKIMEKNLFTPSPPPENQKNCF